MFHQPNLKYKDVSFCFLIPTSPVWPHPVTDFLSELLAIPPSSSSTSLFHVTFISICLSSLLPSKLSAVFVLLFYTCPSWHHISLPPFFCIFIYCIPSLHTRLLFWFLPPPVSLPLPRPSESPISPVVLPHLFVPFITTCFPIICPALLLLFSSLWHWQVSLSSCIKLFFIV